MTARPLTGAEPAQQMLDALRPDIARLDPRLVIVQVADDPASDRYIRKKLDACAAVGMRTEHRHLQATATEQEMQALISELNSDADVTGYIIQLPLPAHLQAVQPLLFRAMDPMKDVDGFTAYNLGKLFLSTDFEHLPPATPAGVIALLEHYDISVFGKNVVVVGHSNIVGKPLAAMLLNRGATVTVCHRDTADLAAHTRQADILCTAVGKAGLITADMVRPGAVVIDIGISETADGIKGDVDFAAVSQVASAITPVPGGVGPMTVASLIRNTVTAKRRQMEKQ